jgi:hypothetical protein
MEETMKTGIVFISLFTALSIVVLVSSSAQAAKSPAMEACSKQWGDMKAAGQTIGQTWPHFWSQCSKDFVAKNGSEVAAPAKSAKAEKESKKPTQTARNDDSPNSAAQKKDCDARWDANKAKTGAHGWHDYFQFMSRCM